MSLSEGHLSEELFSDTSVLLNYVLGQEDEGAYRLVTTSDREIVISQNVHEEFKRVPDRREEIYLDLTRVILTDDENVEDIVISERDYLKGSDASFLRTLREDLVEGDNPEDRLTILREKQKIIDRRFGQTEEIIYAIYDSNPDDILRAKIGKVIGNKDDCKVICDAVSWSGKGGNGDLATLDERHMLSREDDINEKIKEHHGDSHTLNIEDPITFVET